MNGIFDLYAELKKKLKELAGREASIAITNLETSELWAEKAYEVKKLEQYKEV